jgi:hypothetical protein
MSGADHIHNAIDVSPFTVRTSQAWVEKQNRTGFSWVLELQGLQNKTPYNISLRPHP